MSHERRHEAIRAVPQKGLRVAQFVLRLNESVEYLGSTLALEEKFFAESAKSGAGFSRLVLSLRVECGRANGSAKLN